MLNLHSYLFSKKKKKKKKKRRKKHTRLAKGIETGFVMFFFLVDIDYLKFGVNIKYECCIALWSADLNYINPCSPMGQFPSPLFISVCSQSLFSGSTLQLLECLLRCGHLRSYSSMRYIKTSTTSYDFSLHYLQRPKQRIIDSMMENLHLRVGFSH